MAAEPGEAARQSLIGELMIDATSWAEPEAGEVAAVAARSRLLALRAWQFSQWRLQRAAWLKQRRVGTECAAAPRAAGFPGDLADEAVQLALDALKHERRVWTDDNGTATRWAAAGGVATPLAERVHRRCGRARRARIRTLWPASSCAGSPARTRAHAFFEIVF